MDKKIQESYERMLVSESVGGAINGLFDSLFLYLKENLYDAAGTPEQNERVVPAMKNLKKETDKFYKIWKKELKGIGLVGW